MRNVNALSRFRRSRKTGPGHGLDSDHDSAVEVGWRVHIVGRAVRRLLPVTAPLGGFYRLVYGKFRDHLQTRNTDCAK